MTDGIKRGDVVTRGGRPVEYSVEHVRPGFAWIVPASTPDGAGVLAFVNDLTKVQSKWEVGKRYGNDDFDSGITFTVTAVDSDGNALILWSHGLVSARMAGSRKGYTEVKGDE